MIFRRETDVRRWLKQQFKDRVYWVEQARGGTNGFPDALVVLDCEGAFLVPVELKCSEVSDEGFWAPTLRPMQRLFGRSVVKNGIIAFVVIGGKGTHQAWIASFDDCVAAMDFEGFCKVEPIEGIIGIAQRARALKASKTVF